MPAISLRALPCLVAVTLLACASPTEPRQLRVLAAASTVTMENPNVWPVFYLLANPEFLAVVDLALCEDPASPCPRVPPRGSVHVAYSDIVGYAADETQATLWQWRLVRQPDGTYRSIDLQATTVSLH